MTTYLHDDVIFDLTVTHTDVTGVEWQWSGDWNQAGEPLMGAIEQGSVIFLPPLISLPDLYLWHGPLIPTPRRTIAEIYRRVLRQAAA